MMSAAAAAWLLTCACLAAASRPQTFVGLERERHEVDAVGEEGLIESSSQSRALTRGGKYLHPGCPSDAFAPTGPTDAVCGCMCFNTADTKARVDGGAPQCLTCEEGTLVAWEDVPLIEWDGGDCGCTIRRPVRCIDQAANAAYSFRGRVVAGSLSERKDGGVPRVLLGGGEARGAGARAGGRLGRGVRAEGDIPPHALTCGPKNQAWQGALVDWFVSVDSAGSGAPYPVCYTMAAVILARLGAVGTGADDIEHKTRKGQIAQEVSFMNSYDRSRLVKLADFIALRIKQFDSACRIGFDRGMPDDGRAMQEQMKDNMLKHSNGTIEVAFPEATMRGVPSGRVNCQDACCPFFVKGGLNGEAALKDVANVCASYCTSHGRKTGMCVEEYDV
ncbi:unnamed protein product [Prorocentrum cordatum]|uniref:Uncharacterized protein n=1 Tax=Prorocentrum cordatum TaxID=2364126 RepID=A0ABN9W0Z9_9DINO|nr:unnamed protein product [Polarella glacialis]